MNFFKSVFAEDSPPSSPPSPDPQSPQTLISPSSSAAATTTTTTAATTAWNFNGLIQSISSKSDSLLETYRRDLQEFRVGLASETQTLKHVAATSLDVAAAKGTVSLESFGNAIDSLGSVVSEIIFNAADQINDDNSSSSETAAENRAIGVKYSRFEAQLKAIQGDESTYLDDPVEDDGGEFEKWKLGFNLGEFDSEVEELLSKKEIGVDLIYEKLVPNLIDNDTFWLRYFYRVYRLKQAEFVRARLVQRAIEADNDDEDLSWDVDDEEDDKDKEKVEETVKKDDVGEEKAEDNVEETVKKGDVEEEKAEDNVEETVKKDEEEACVEQKSDNVGSKDSDISVISSQRSSHEEEDLGWDEIEDLGSGDDEKKGGGSPNRAELRKRLSSAEVVDDDEDLSWDIEDDDEPIKS